MALVNQKTSNSDRFKIVTEVKPKQRMIVSAVGIKDKSGKTNFGLTAPGPQCIFDFNRSLEGVIEKFNGVPKTVLTYTVPRNDPNPQESSQELWAEFTGEFHKALELDYRSLIVDLGTEVWELCRLADHGKLEKVQARYYGGTNRAYAALMNAVKETDKNLILLHRMKKEYVSDAWSGGYEPAFCPETPGIVQVNVKLWHLTEKQAEEQEEVPGFHLEVINCRQRYQCVGERLQNDEITFANLGMLVFPDSDYEDWC